MRMPSMLFAMWMAGACVSVCQTAAAAIHTVGIGSGFDFTSVQAAIDAASSGDTIEISAGTFTEGTKPYRGNNLLTGLNFENKENLLVRGAGADRTVIDGTGVAYGLMFDSSDNVTISGITFINGSLNSATFYNNPTNSRIEYSILGPGSVENYYDGTSLDHVTFLGSGGDLFSGLSANKTTSVTNSIIVDINNLSSGSSPSSSLIVSHTNLYQVSNPNYTSGVIISTLDPQFVNAGGGDFHLAPTSPLLTLADDGTYLGALGASTAAVPEATTFVTWVLLAVTSLRFYGRRAQNGLILDRRSETG